MLSQWKSCKGHAAFLLCLLLGLVFLTQSGFHHLYAVDRYAPRYSETPSSYVSNSTISRKGPLFNISQSKWRCSDPSTVSERNLDCRRRLPQAIGMGAKKCGTSAVLFFLSNHPAVSPAPSQESHQWDWHPKRSIDDYRRTMPVTSQYQITMEKTPAYFVGEDIPSAIARDVSPHTKLLLILRDPVKRAISDYTHVIDMHPHMLPRVNRRGRLPKYPQPNITYVIEDTFEDSVLLGSGAVNTKNAIVFTGMYSRHLRNWLEVFPLDQIHIIDGDAFSKNPLPHLQAIESFLGIPQYFDEDKVYFDDAKGFYCLTKPSKHCQGKNKGRKHPHVDEGVLEILHEFYRPYNHELEKLTARTFSWMKSQ